MYQNTLLITSAINPIGGMKTSSPSIRLEQTIDALNIICNLSIFSNIYIVDSTGFDLSNYINQIETKKCNLFTSYFEQDILNVTKYGYGYGEILIYKHFNIIVKDRNCCFYKISGRYIVENMSDLISSSTSLDNFFYSFYPKFFEFRKYVHSAFFKMKLSDLDSCIKFCSTYLIERPLSPLEEALYYWICSRKFKKKWIYLPSPEYKGVSGLVGKKVEDYYFPYNFFRKFDFLSIMCFSYF